MRALFPAACLLLAGCGSGAIEDGPFVSDDSGAPVESGVDAGNDVEASDAADTAVDVAPDAPPPMPAVRLVGRFTAKDEFSWSGTQMIARFSGTGARINLTAASNQQFQIVVDDKPTSVLKPMSGSMTYTLASGLPSGEHEIVVWRRTEAFFGTSTYEGFEFDGTLLAPTPVDRRIETIGDSITCGYGDEGTSASCSFSADTENHYLTYGAIASRALNADVVATCWSGLGMYRNYGGDTTGTMPERYLKTLPQVTAASPWDFSRWVPHVVVINLGTNDFAKGDPGSAYQTSYLEFVRDVRKNYPAAWIVAIIPVSGAKKYIDAVVSTLNGEGDAKVSSLTLSAITTADGWGCDYHPTLITHARWGKELEAAIRARTGW